MLKARLRSPPPHPAGRVLDFLGGVVRGEFRPSLGGVARRLLRCGRLLSGPQSDGAPPAEHHGLWVDSGSLVLRGRGIERAELRDVCSRRGLGSCRCEGSGREGCRVRALQRVREREYWVLPLLRTNLIAAQVLVQWEEADWVGYCDRPGRHGLFPDLTGARGLWFGAQARPIFTFGYII